ncbi:MAG: hypothetical protein ABDH21_01985 [bacterium]
MKESRLTYKIIKIAFLIFLIVFSLYNAWFSKQIYSILSKTSLYDTTLMYYQKISQHDVHDEEEARELVYFENEFVFQPYVNPLPSSIELVKLSLSLIILSLVIFVVRKD